MISHYITKSNVPYINQSIEEILTNQVRDDQVIMYLWQNDNTVVIGRNQNAWRECRLEAFEEEKGKLMRRITGGGAVYQDMGNQIFSFIAPKKLYDLDKQMEVIRRAVGSFGIEAVKQGRNDILADGKKFSGNAFRKTQHAMVHHGTILISADMGRLARFLNPSKEKLEAKGVTSVRSRVINLNELNQDLTPAKMQAALITSFNEVYGETSTEIPDSEIDSQELNKMATNYANESWLLGPVSNFNFELHNRFTFGELEFRLAVDGGIINKTKIYSDALDVNWILAIEAAFVGIPFTKKALINAIPESEQPTDKNELADYINNLNM
ncbi:MAG: lipoate--protein ligase [Defluviitaleaceae bacterium]|nr:lipoate--protein ligase [Defluviitaleaceae bacterium]